jgi:hypothetical protein
MRQIRKLPGRELVWDMLATYGKALARSAIRYRLTPDGITLTKAAPHPRSSSVWSSGTAGSQTAASSRTPRSSETWPQGRRTAVEDMSSLGEHREGRPDPEWYEHVFVLFPVHHGTTYGTRVST